MRIIHRIAGVTSVQPGLIRDLQAAGMCLTFYDDTPVFSVEVEEADSLYDEVAAIAARHSAVETTWSEFTSEELSASEFVALGTPAWMNDYPQPEDDFERLSYDLSNACGRCGIGKVQNAPFRLKRAPKWGRRDIFKLNWVPDAFFVSPRLWPLFESAGVELWPVLDKRGDTLENVRQIRPPVRVPLDFDDSRLLGLDPNGCPYCKNVQRWWPARGFVPRPQGNVEAPVFASNDSFGAGAEFGSLVYLSNSLYRQVDSIRGISFKACLPAV